MAFRTLESVSVWGIRPPWAGGTCLELSDELIDVEWTEAEDADQDVATVRAPFDSRIAAQFAPRRILVLHGTPPDGGGTGDYRVFRIHTVVSEQSRDGLTRTAQCRSLLADWTDAGPMSVPLAGGKHEFTIAATLNWVQWFTTFAIPHLNRQGMTWFLADTLTNATPITGALVRQTPMQLAEMLRGFLAYKLRLSPFGAVGLVEHPNDTLDPLLITIGKNLVRISETRASIEQATVLQPVNGKGHSDASGSIQHHVFGSSSYDYPNKRFQRDVLAPGGWSYPLIVADNQFVGLYAQRVKTGRCFQITASDPVTQRLTLDALTDPGTHPHGFWFELRESITPGTPISVPVPGRPLRVSGAPVGTTLTLDDPLASGDPSPTDDVHVDCRLIPSAQVLSSTCSNIADVLGTNEQTLTIPVTAAPLVGDWGFLHDNAGTPWTLFGKVFDVIAVPSTTSIRVRIRYTYDSGKPFTAGAVAKQLKLYRARTNRPHVDDEVAATNQLTVTSATGIASQDLVEYTLDNSGALLTGIPAPSSAPSLDGVVRKTKDFADHRCILNLFGDSNLNPHFDLWGFGVPFGWTGSSITQLTTNLPGPGLVNAVRITNGSLRSPIVYVRPTAGDSKVSVRVRVRTPSAANWNGANQDQATLNVLVGGSSTSLGLVNIHSPGHPSPSPGSAEIKPSTVLEWDFPAVDLLHTPGPGVAYAPWSGIQVNVSCTGTVAAQLDIGGVFAIQDSTLPEAGYMPKDGEQFVWGLAGQELAAIASPERAVSVDAIDLGALLVTEYPAAELVPGRRVQVVSEALGVAIDERIAQCRFRARPRGSVTVDVRTRERRLVDVLARQLASRLTP